MTEHMDIRFEVSTSALRVPAPGGVWATAASALASRVADGPAVVVRSGLLGGDLLGYGLAQRQRPAAGTGALIPNPPVLGLPPVLRQVLTS